MFLELKYSCGYIQKYNFMSSLKDKLLNIGQILDKERLNIWMERTSEV